MSKVTRYTFVYSYSILTPYWYIKNLVWNSLLWVMLWGCFQEYYNYKREYYSQTNQINPDSNHKSTANDSHKKKESLLNPLTSSICKKILFRRLRILSWISCNSILTKSCTVSGPSIIQNLNPKPKHTNRNQMIQSIQTTTKICISSRDRKRESPGGALVGSVGVDGGSKRRRRRRRGVGVGGPRSPSRAELGVYMTNSRAPEMATVVTRRVWRVRDRHYSTRTEHPLKPDETKALSLSLSLSLCIQFFVGELW